MVEGFLFRLSEIVGEALEDMNFVPNNDFDRKELKNRIIRIFIDTNQYPEADLLAMMVFIKQDIKYRTDINYRQEYLKNVVRPRTENDSNADIIINEFIRLLNTVRDQGAKSIDAAEEYWEILKSLISDSQDVKHNLDIFKDLLENVDFSYLS
jgi:hypothetical protein